MFMDIKNMDKMVQMLNQSVGAVSFLGALDDTGIIVTSRDASVKEK